MGIAALIVSGGVLLSRVLGQVREIIFAGLLGASGDTDVYVAAFTLPDFLNYLLAGGFLSITFIPIFARYLADDDEEGGWAALTAVIRPLTAGIVALVVVGWVATPWAVELLFDRFDAEQVAETVRLTRIVLPAQVFFVLGALYTAVQYGKGRFFIPTLAPIVYNLGIIVGGVGFALVTGTPEPEGFIWGALAGAFVGNFALQYWGARGVGMRWVPGTSWSHPALGEYLRIALPLMIGQSIVVLDETFMRVFGNKVGEAAATQLQYARRTMMVPVGVVAQAAAVAAYPFLARLFAEGKRREMADTLDRSLASVVSASVVATALIVALSQPFVRTLFERGAFEPADTVATASALFFYSFSIPAWGASQVVTRAFYARRQMWTPVAIGTAASLLVVPLYLVLHDRFGLEGVAVASTLGLGIYAVALVARWYGEPDHRHRLGLVAAGPMRSVPLAAGAGAAAFGVAWLVVRAMGQGWPAAVVAAVAGTAVFAGVGVVLGSWLYDRFGSGTSKVSAGGTSSAR